MNKLIWRMYNENRISLEVAEELLDCHYNRTNKVYQMKELRWNLTKAHIVWLQQIRNQNWLKLEDTEMVNSILYRTDYDKEQKLRLNVLRETYISAKSYTRQQLKQGISMSGKVSGYTEKIFTQDEVNDILTEIKDMVDDLGWDEQRMSQSGKSIYNNLVNYLEEL